jgi:hypothetical protein
VVDYRNRYAQYKMDPDLAAAHRSAPFIVTWDDHEVDNNYAGNHDEHGTPAELFLLRRAAAYQAYYENMPLRAAAIPRGADMRLYRRPWRPDRPQRPIRGSSARRSLRRRQPHRCAEADLQRERCSR